MMRHVLKPLAVAVAACACCSCARTESENFNEIEDKALDIWVSSNAPDAEPLGDTGMYYEVIKALRRKCHEGGRPGQVGGCGICHP